MVEKIAGLSFGMRDYGIQNSKEDTQAPKKTETLDWTDNAADAVSEVFNNTEDFSTLFE